MPGDDLDEPLGLAPSPQASAQSKLPFFVSALAVGSAIIAIGFYVTLQGDGRNGEPFAVARIERVKPAEALPALTETRAPEDTPLPAAGAAESADVATEAGVNVIRLRAAAKSTAVVIKVAPAAASLLAPAPDPRLVEKGPFGPLPRIGPDGSRPAEVYARPAVLDPASAKGKPRVAILVGGMGLNEAATRAAMSALPPAVSFGFAPYGDDVEAQVKAARDAGHEVFLQVPMEDFGHAESGLSHMLLAGQAGNRERLHWLMSRFTGYAGLCNYLGGRFLSEEEALRPVLQEAAARGLSFIDDGSSPLSLATTLAAETGTDSLRADVVIDAKPDPAAIDEALSRLDTLARQRGWAFGTAAGLPATNALLAHYAAESAAHGVAIVPVTEILALSQHGHEGAPDVAAAPNRRAGAASVPQGSAAKP